MTINPIETRYAGCRFRSRLEARWAVFFDALGIAWEYEPQGYEVGPSHDRRQYLPDFWLPAHCVWVEVKGDRESADLRKIAYAADVGYGLPGEADYRMLLLGNVPRVERDTCAWHNLIRHGLAPVPVPDWMRCIICYTHARGGQITHTRNCAEYGTAPRAWGELTQALFRFVPRGIDFMGDPPGLLLGSARDDYADLNIGPSFWQFDAFATTVPLGYRDRITGPSQPQVVAAYAAARSARFEYGQSG